MKRGFQNDIVVALAFHRKKIDGKKIGEKKVKNAFFVVFTWNHMWFPVPKWPPLIGSVFFVPQDHNPPNAPQIQPIENFFGILKPGL